MGTFRRRRGGLALAALLIVLLLQFNLASIAGAAAPNGQNGDDGAVEKVDNTPSGKDHARHPLLLKVRGHDSVNAPLVTSTTPYGYTPQQIRSYLGLSGDGSGQTIAIVDAYDDPNIAADLNAFSQQFGLPLICGTLGAVAGNCVNFTKSTPQGTPTVDAGWALEIALDVEWAHAVAPKASLLLVEATSANTSNLFSAIDYAAQHGATVISNSWGTSEFSGESSNDAHCALSTAVCTFAAGDSGNPGMYPAYNPNVVAVGGTTLSLSSSGAVLSERAWSGSGGGASVYESRPAYQSQAQTTAYRGIPDVSYDADPSTGFAVYDSVSYSSQTGWFQVGGTSAGAPQWAGIIAAANQLRAGQGKSRLVGAAAGTNTALYQLTSALYDVTVGTNGSCGTGCTAGPGYDFVTGLGSPRAGIDAALANAGAATGGSPPSAPSNLQATAINSTTIRFTWTDTAANESGFYLSNGATQQSVPAASGSGNTVTYDWTGLPAGTTSCARVAAYNGSGTSAWTPQSCATTPASASVYVQSLTLSQLSSNVWYRTLGGNVTIRSSAGPVANATVQLWLTGPYTSQTFSVTTNAQGVGSFSRTVYYKGTYTLRVQNVAASGYTYQSSLNQQTTASATAS